MSPKGRKSPARNPEQGAPLSRRAKPSPNLCLKGMEGSQGDPLHASHPCTRERPTARLSQARSPDPRKTSWQGRGKTELPQQRLAQRKSSGAGREGWTSLPWGRECLSHHLPRCLPRRGEAQLPGDRAAASRSPGVRKTDPSLREHRQAAGASARRRTQPPQL